MDKIWAFTDEYGAFGWDLDKQDVSTTFIISAIIVKDNDLDYLRSEVEKIRHNRFQTGEMKSSKIGKNFQRRINVLNDLISLPFNIFSVVVDKRECAQMKGLRYKKSFYKFMNNIVHQELRNAFTNLTIVADEIGGSDYMASFVNYVRSKQDIPNLFDEREFSFEASHNDVLIQLADLISGTLSFVYDPKRKEEDKTDYLSILKAKLIRVMTYPLTFKTFLLTSSAVTNDYDSTIAQLCFKQAASFFNEHKENDDTDVSICNNIAINSVIPLGNTILGIINTNETINKFIWR